LQIAAIIPARYASTRFPGKPLASIAGRPMIARVYQQVSSTEIVDFTMVATDDLRIVRAVEEYGGEAVMTSSSHSSGTDRLAEAAAGVQADIIVNVQGDEPLIKPEMIAQAVTLLQQDKEIKMATLAAPAGPEIARDPDRVKVVLDQQNRALYFSRTAIPAVRGDNCQRESGSGEQPEFLQHIGLYVYQREFLMTFSGLQPTPLEKRESLEQLRALENGYKIGVGICRHHGPGVDRPEDIASVEEIIFQEEKGG